MITERLIQRVDELIEMGNAVLRTRQYDDYGGHSVDGGTLRGFRVASLSFIGRVYGEKAPHFTEFSSSTEINSPSSAEHGLGILRAIRGEIEGGWLFTVKSLVTAEVFTDFMEMAEYLLESGYRDPAAVMAGSVLEEHLRQLCMKNGIPITQRKDGKDVPSKADFLNSELAKAGVYNKLEQKQVTTWLDLRNNAAHGKYGEYKKEHVEEMIRGVTGFMARVAV